jgi:hypothetical protein
VQLPAAVVDDADFHVHRFLGVDERVAVAVVAERRIDDGDLADRAEEDGGHGLHNPVARGVGVVGARAAGAVVGVEIRHRDGGTLHALRSHEHDAGIVPK